MLISIQILIVLWEKIQHSKNNQSELMTNTNNKTEITPEAGVFPCCLTWKQEQSTGEEGRDLVGAVIGKGWARLT